MLWKHLYPDCTHTCTHISPVVAKFEASTFSEVLCVYTYMCVFMCKFVFLCLCVCVFMMAADRELAKVGVCAGAGGSVAWS